MAKADFLSGVFGVGSTGAVSYRLKEVLHPADQPGILFLVDDYPLEGI